MLRNLVPGVIGGPFLLNPADPVATRPRTPRYDRQGCNTQPAICAYWSCVMHKVSEQKEGKPMIRRKLIVRSVLTRRGIEKFEEAVNDHLAKGWEPVAVEIDQKLFCTLCFAVLSFPTRCDCQCTCCTGEATHSEDCKCACDCCMIHSDQVKKAPKEDDE